MSNLATRGLHEAVVSYSKGFDFPRMTHLADYYFLDSLAFGCLKCFI